MIVKKPGMAVRRHPRYFAVPLLLALATWVMMLNGGSLLYWGPLDSDLRNQFYPWQVFIHRWLTQGVFPFWDPHVFGGYPTIETQQMLALNPVHLLTLWLPPNFGLIAMTALNTLIGCIVMGWGLWRLGKCTAMAAALGAGLYVFGALFSVRVMAGHFTVVAALAWWPLAALSVLAIARSVSKCLIGDAPEKGLLGLLRQYGAFSLQSYRSVRFRRLVALSAVAHAMVCMAGAPQYIVYLFYIDMAVVFAAARRGAWVPVLISVAAVWVLALAVSAPQWLPALWYLPYSVRGVSSGGATGWSLRPLYNIWFETMLPFPFGDDMNHGHLLYMNVWETALYPGSIALVLSATLILRVVWWRIRIIVGHGRSRWATITPLCLAGVVISLLGLYMMAGGWLPGFSGFREPLKARAVVAFGIAVMAASAFDGIVRRPAEWRRFLIAGTALVFFLILSASDYHDPKTFRDLVTGFGMPPFDPQASATYAEFLENPKLAADRYYLACLWAQAGVSLTILCLLIMRRAPRVAVTFLLLCALLDPFLAHAPAWLGRHPWSESGLPKPVAEYFAPKLAADKGELPWRVILHSSIINRTHHMEGLYEFHGYDPLMPAFAVGRMLVKGILDVPDMRRAELRTDLLERAGVRYDARIEGLKSLIADAATSAPQILIVPKATLFNVSRKVIAGSPGINLFGPDLNGNHYVLPSKLGGKISEHHDIPADFQTQISEMFPKGAASTSSTSQLLPGESMDYRPPGRPDEFRVQVNLARPALLLYKGTWTPGWRVYIDGQDHGRALFANNWMSGVIVPRGRHEVVFRYRPVMWIPSLAICGVGSLGLLLLILVRRGIMRGTGAGAEVDRI